jgi:hypothetical protein
MVNGLLSVTKRKSDRVFYEKIRESIIDKYVMNKYCHLLVRTVFKVLFNIDEKCTTSLRRTKEMITIAFNGGVFARETMLAFTDTTNRDGNYVNNIRPMLYIFVFKTTW